MERTFGLIGALLGFLGVALGAFGGHGLRGRLSPRDLEIYEVAVRYQMYHALALLLVALWIGRALPSASSALSGAGWALTAGTILFSGSLYLLVLTGVRSLGALTPIGGFALLLGWALLGLALWRMPG